jgi:hypothetical protein
MFGCQKCKALEKHNEYLQRVIDSLLKHVGADPARADKSLADQIPKIIDEEEAQGSEDPAEEFGQ